jgi:predicted Zn-dependent protease
VQYGVKNLRFNQSIIEMLGQVEMMSPPQRTAGEETFDMVVPAIKVREFSFSSLTKF